MPMIAVWSAPDMISETEAQVGRQRVWTRILRSPLDEVYSRAAWNVTSLVSRRSSSIDTCIPKLQKNLHDDIVLRLVAAIMFLTLRQDWHLGATTSQSTGRKSCRGMCVTPVLEKKKLALVIDKKKDKKRTKLLCKNSPCHLFMTLSGCDE